MPPIKEITPYKEATTPKKDQVRLMFDRIARHYDFLNHFLSLGIDIQWRKKAVAEIAPWARGQILDVATGTGDVAFTVARKYPEARVIAVDISGKMLEIARRKSARKGLTEQIHFYLGDSENLDFPDNSFSAVTVAFGVRNFENLLQGLKEMQRVVHPGGKAVILEFTKPESFPFRQIFNGYFRYLLPWIGKLRSRDRRAYRYLYESVQAFPDYERFTEVMVRAGWKDPQYKVLSLGICAIYTATK